MQSCLKLLHSEDMRRGINLSLFLKWVIGVTFIVLLGLVVQKGSGPLLSPNSGSNSKPVRGRTLQRILMVPHDGVTHSEEAEKIIPNSNIKTLEKTIEYGSPKKWIEGLPTLYIVTPTYPRAEQLPELTRFAQTLMNVPNLVWIVSEDASEPTNAIIDYLNECGIKTVYLRVQMPEKYQKVKNKPRGVANRLAGINWIREHATEGVFYFADDDNTYDIRLFEQMRWTKRVSMFPVGLVTKLGVSTPIVKGGKVIGFYDGWIAKRKFPIDMAGFAVNVQYLLDRPNATMPFKVGYEEDGFMLSLGVRASEIEPLAFNCSKIWVWHTQTKKNDPATDVVQNDATKGSNLDLLKHQLWKGKKGQKTPVKKKS